jgi:hypothetical protein
MLRQWMLGPALAIATAAACAGSSSESPWPVEPVNTEPDPRERTKRGIDPKELPNRYGKGGGDAEPPEAPPEQRSDKSDSHRRGP